jgi:hypothetical protein
MTLVTRIEISDSPDLQHLAASGDFDLHDYLSDQADWNAPYWEFEVGRMYEYCRKLQELFALTGSGFSFQALWVGEKPKHVEVISIEDLVSLLQTNRLRTSAKYMVSKGA